MYLKDSLPKDTKGTPNLVDLESVRRFQPIQAIKTQSQISGEQICARSYTVDLHKFAPVDVVVYAYGRVNDPMAKLQFLRVGWGGVGWGGDDDILWTWTHGGCYATVLVL